MAVWREDAEVVPHLGAAESTVELAKNSALPVQADGLGGRQLAVALWLYHPVRA